MFRKILLTWVVLLIGTTVSLAQKREVILQQMEQIRNSPSYIYAEATSLNIDQAFRNAQKGLQTKVNAWIAERTGMPGLKATLLDIDKTSTWMNTRSGQEMHTFIYLRKSEFVRLKPKMQIRLRPEEDGEEIQTGKPLPPQGN